MSKLNTRTNVVAKSPLSSSSVSDVCTHEGGVAFSRNAKSELYVLGVNYFAGEDTFYESAKDRETRFSNLVAQVAIEDPKWIHGFLWWLRTKGNIRTASIMGAAIAVHARLNDPASVAMDRLANTNRPSWNRLIIRDVCQRADEPGEFLAYWTKEYGRTLPQPVKRGLSDAVAKLYNQYSYMKYDSAGSAWRFGDVINMTHAKPKLSDEFSQSSLFGLAIADRHGNATPDMWSDLPMIVANKNLREKAKTRPEVLLDADLLQAAGFTWEDALSLAGNKIDKGKLWDAIAPNMGIFALTRNLRNMEQAGISSSTRKMIQGKLEDPEIIAKSRMFPFRFWSAYKNSVGLSFASSLETALNLSVSNVPELTGNSLVLSDISASMSSPMSNKSDTSYAEAAAIFAGALALKNPGHVEFVGFADNTFTMPVPKGASLLRVVSDFHRRNGSVGGGTQTVNSLRKHFVPGNHDRVFIITDMQAFQDYGYGYSRATQTVASVVNDQAYLYGFSLGGYHPSMLQNSGTGKIHELSGLTDSSFQLPALLERGRTQNWPWED